MKMINLKSLVKKFLNMPILLKTDVIEFVNMEVRSLSDQTDKTKVVILTINHRIKGDISLYSNVRLTDYVVEAKPFMAVTDAEVMDMSGKLIFNASFLNVQKDHIEIIMPVDMVADQTA